MPRGGLVGILPPQLRFSAGDAKAAAMWGATAAVGAIWLVQPFDYIRTIIKGPTSAGEEGGAPSAGGTGLQEKSDAANVDS
ncbi:hypothetical protein WJX75_006032 [Coccomyxa subellipsoidea]|uniref:Uncharacterized protein n=1 Tax=Coccomyxa subellipsoidea TaxID=248742 RepID=A0ABR2YSE9_9CHLO